MSEQNLIVAKHGKCDFNSIQEALNAASDGAEIFIEGGTYNESLVIDKAVKLYGSKKHMPLISVESGNVCKVSAAANISFIHFNNKKGVNPGNENAGLNCMVEVSSDAVFNNCDFSGAADSTIKVSGENIKASFYDCHIHNGNRNGFSLKGGCKPVIKNCKIHDFGNSGISIESSSPVVEDCEIYNCNGKCYIISSGILLGKKSGGSYKKCRIHNIKGDGIQVIDKSNPIVEDCVIYNCNLSFSEKFAVGINISHESSGLYKNCLIYNIIKGVGIYVEDSSSDIENCDIYNSYIGIGSSTSSIQCKNCNIRNMKNGVMVDWSSTSDIENIDIDGCKNNGIWIDNESKGRCKNCNIRNVQNGVMVDKSSISDIENIDIDGCKKNGIEIDDKSKGRYKNCKIRNVKNGVMVDSSSIPNIENFDIDGCKKNGIWINNESKGSYKNCKIRNVKNGVMVQGSSAPTIGNFDIDGCKKQEIKSIPPSEINYENYNTTYRADKNKICRSNSSNNIEYC